MTRRLHTRTLGESGPRMALTHGVFGQGRNWTQIAKALSSQARCTLVDLPNHGHSPWTQTFSYAAMADALSDEMRALDDSEPWFLVGHSMGGKTAMLAALRHPGLLRGLAVVDVSPVDYGTGREFDDLVAALQALPLDALDTRTAVDDELAESLGDKGVRAFLLQNLHRDHGHWSWRMNLDLLEHSIPALSGWPAADVPDGAAYEGPTVWIAGAHSAYVTPDYADDMRTLFPRARLVTVKDAAHWVHSEQPEVVVETLRRLLTA